MMGEQVPGSSCRPRAAELCASLPPACLLIVPFMLHVYVLYCSALPLLCSPYCSPLLPHTAQHTNVHYIAPRGCGRYCERKLMQNSVKKGEAQRGRKEQEVSGKQGSFQ